MSAPEFDEYAEGYLKAHADNTRLTGEEPDYFARYKIVEICRRLRARGEPLPRAVLDFGTGIGNSLPYLREMFPEADIVGLDVSATSIAIAEHRYPGVAKLAAYDGQDIPLQDAGYDLVFSSCVFHHIDDERHVETLSRLRRLVAPGGRMVIFEHNPINPVTRYIVATCPFDENAVLISAREFRNRQLAAGFSKVDVRFTGFFPGPLAKLRPIEPLLGHLPVGAQYYTWAQA
jgi:SAM-dependent methyltransferase